MPSPPNITNITPPRVPLIDERTGLISREWYRFFLNLFNLTGGGSNVTSLTDLQLGPPTPQQEDLVDIIIDVEATKIQPTEESANEQIAELAKQVEGLAATPIPALGTFAALQQANLPWTTFDTTPQSVPSVTTGTLYWDNEDRAKTLALVMEDTGNIIQDIGEDTFYRVKATATITKGQVLMFTGTVGASGGLLAAPATGLNAFQSEYILGIATQNIALNGWGYATWFGEVSKVNTTGGVEAWVDGQILYYNPAVTGGLTKNVPTAPNPKVIVASVVHAATNGILFVRPTFGSALGATDANVEITSLTNGDILQYDGTQLRWENVPASTLSVGTATNLAGGATGSVPYQSAASTTTFLPIGTALQVLKVNAGATAPQWVSGAALTKVDDTNVTLTLGGTPATSLLAATSLTLGWTGELAATRGGTGFGSYAVGDILYANTTTTLAKLPDVATGNALISGGVGVAPAWGKIGLTTHVSGTLPVGNGGTGTATAFTAGSVVFAGASGVYSQDNANFFWDAANVRLGIDTASPACALDVAGGIQTSRTSVTSPATTDGNIFSGTYVPTQVSTNTNVDAVTFSTSHYMRVGNTVTVGGQISIDATTAATDTIVKMSFPIASAISSNRQCGGTGSSLTTPYAANNMSIFANTADDCVEIRLRPSLNTNLAYAFSFTYLVI
jgi:hypothetical protein